jgi:hypothetical protein
VPASARWGIRPGRATTLDDVTTQHEIRIDGDRAWCETCGWTDVTHGYYNAQTRAFLHFSDPDPVQHSPKGEPSPTWNVCEFCGWPDRVWPSGRPYGAPGVTEWPRPAIWEWEIRGRAKSWALACDEHEDLGPGSSADAYKHVLRSA